MPLKKKPQDKAAGSTTPRRPASAHAPSKARIIATIITAAGKLSGKSKHKDELTPLVQMNKASSTIREWYDTTISVLNVVLTGTATNGLPGGRVTELYGDEQTGKTTMCSCMIAKTQETNGIGVYHDTESTFTEDRAAKLGINTSELIYGEVEHLEDVLDIMVSNVVSMKKSRGIIVLDTIAGTKSRGESGKRVGEGSISPHARSLSQGMRRLARPLARSNCAVICVNQMKEGGIGSMYATERKREATLGGRAIRFHATIRLRLAHLRKYRIAVGSNKTIAYGDEVKATVTKNKDGPSGIKACECILVIVSVGKRAGTFDAGLSALRTLQYWGVYPEKSDRIKFKQGVTHTPLSWSAAYAKDAKFRSEVDALLVKTRASLLDSGAVAPATAKKTTRTRRSAPVEDEDE